MHYLVTGHTGFKGAWLTLLLASRGHQVSGIALDPISGSLFERAEVAQLLSQDLRLDIRDSTATLAALGDVNPDVVIHLAAQPLVRESYRTPRSTFETNVMGTLNILDAVSRTSSVKAHLVVTTDKVYKNTGRLEGYSESAPLGGHDPYSASKAMADILTQSWVASFGGPHTAIARAGNVIGGGDISPERLMPDLLEAFSAGRPAQIRYPSAIRPWQHVLDCLAGYLALTDSLIDGENLGEWNFGPGRESHVTVGHFADVAAARWGGDAEWISDSAEHLHEASVLALDTTKVESTLHWKNRLAFPASLEWTIAWQQAVQVGESPRAVTAAQIAEFERLS